MMMPASNPFIKVDFHMHSQHSDGSLTPQALFALAVEQELDQISITDHDTVAAYADLAAYGPGHNKGIKIIPGCEFSCLWAGRNIHVLGLNLNLQHRGLIKAMAFQANARVDRAQTIAEVLAKFGFKDTLEGAQAKATGDIVGRPHFAQHLVDAGHVKNMRQAFQLYLGAGKPGDIKSSWPDLIQVCQWISEAGGVAVIAHPMKYGLTLTKLRKLCVEFKAAGGLGLEVISGSQDPVKTDTLAMLAVDYDFFASAGSDFHQPGQTWAELGKVVSLPVRCTPIWQCWQ
jgi:predicted metal-dependent phosphoesterase TrpH